MNRQIQIAIQAVNEDEEDYVDGTDEYYVYISIPEDWDVDTIEDELKQYADAIGKMAGA
jgi:hypothetical protein